jgi:hypothetical protein
MLKNAMTKLTVLSTPVSWYTQKDEYYIIQNWIRTRNTIEFLGLWEQMNNPDFKSIEFDAFRKQAGLNGPGQYGLRLGSRYFKCRPVWPDRLRMAIRHP